MSLAVERKTGNRTFLQGLFTPEQAFGINACDLPLGESSPAIFIADITQVVGNGRTPNFVAFINTPLDERLLANALANPSKRADLTDMKNSWRSFKRSRSPVPEISGKDWRRLHKSMKRTHPGLGKTLTAQTGRIIENIKHSFYFYDMEETPDITNADMKRILRENTPYSNALRRDLRRFLQEGLDGHDYDVDNNDQFWKSVDRKTARVKINPETKEEDERRRARLRRDVAARLIDDAVIGKLVSLGPQQWERDMEVYFDQQRTPEGLKGSDGTAWRGSGRDLFLATRYQVELGANGVQRYRINHHEEEVVFDRRKMGYASIEHLRDRHGQFSVLSNQDANMRVDVQLDPGARADGGYGVKVKVEDFHTTAVVMPVLWWETRDNQKQIKTGKLPYDVVRECLQIASVSLPEPLEYSSHNFDTLLGPVIFSANSPIFQNYLEQLDPDSRHPALLPYHVASYLPKIAADINFQQAEDLVRPTV